MIATCWHSDGRMYLFVIQILAKDLFCLVTRINDLMACDKNYETYQCCFVPSNPDDRIDEKLVILYLHVSALAISVKCIY